jgi:hypothetical protein
MGVNVWERIGGGAGDANARVATRDGDGNGCRSSIFAGTTPHSLFVVARSRFFSLSWHHTRLLFRFCFIIQFIL